MFDILTPEFLAAFLGLFGTILTALIGVAVKAVYAYTGIQIEAKHREALHQAILSGVEAAILHGGAEGLRTAKQLGIAHLQRSAPDAVRYLVPGDSVLDVIAERYVNETLNKWHMPADGTAAPTNFTQPRGQQ